MALSPLQKKQVDFQLQQHIHDSYKIDITLSEGHILKDFTVAKNVLRPEKMAAVYLARYLFFNNGLYKNKVVVDMGCGSGIQGIVASLYGAKKTIFTDISPDAVENCKLNVEHYKLNEASEVVKGDLFQNVNNKADLIIFNHPFFSDDPIPESPISKAMLDSGDLFQRFLRECKNRLNGGGIIITVYFDVAGDTNNPSIQGVKNGYIVTERFNLKVSTGLQKGHILIHELTLK